jgi:hypothetical protein
MMLFFLAALSASSTSQLDRRSIVARHLNSEKFMFNYQSQSISFGDWMLLLTLCFAPLIAHLVAGVPPTGELTQNLILCLCSNPSVTLSHYPPHWTDRVCHFNPTSILWRYFAIFDRRVRCLNWTASDMAASNAHFWVGDDWDGSEEMIVRSRRFCTRIPSRSYIEPLSASAVKTLIVTFQGAQALSAVAGTVSVNSNYSMNVSLATIFLPIAIFGLLRLPAALWMSEDLAYGNQDMLEVRVASFEQDKGTVEGEKLIEAERLAPSMVMPVEPQDEPIPPRFRAVNGLYGIATRAFYLATLLTLTGFTLYNIFPPSMETGYWTATGFSQIIFFLFFLLATFSIFTFYFLRGNSTTTIIPCVNSAWYKLYTFLLFLGMLVLITLAAIETRKAWCGVWTTFPPRVPGLPNHEWNYCPQSIEGIQATELSWTRNNETSYVTNFNGMISGSWTP